MNILSVNVKQFKCINCGKEWTDYKSNDKNKKFCSIKCKSDYSRTERVCNNCGKKFTICKSTIEQSNSTGRYCSRKCYIDKIRTGVTKNKNGFRTISSKLRKGNPVCAICGTTKRIHIHHIEAYRYTKNNNLDNLIPLCIKHHKVVEIIMENLLKIDKKENVFKIIKIILLGRQQVTKFICK